MKYVKENLTLVICAGVALVFLVFAFAPIPFAVPSLKAGLAAQMQERYNHIKTVQQWSKEALVLPGADPAKGQAKGIPPKNWVEAKTSLMKNINDQQKEVEAAAGAGNARGRVEGKVPLLPVPNAPLPEQMKGVPMAGYLPKVTSDPMMFKVSYGKQFRVWRNFLATGGLTEVEDDAAAPPKEEILKAAFDAKKLAEQAQLAPGMTVPGIGTSANPAEQMAYERTQLMNRAAGLRMYVDPNAFQIRSWFGQDAPPDDAQVFEAFADSWFESDVVKAIVTVNNQALAGVGAGDRNVGKSGIKRLTRIMVGNNARVRYLTGSTTGGVAVSTADPGPLFFTAANSSLVGSSGGPLMAGVPVAASDSGTLATRPSSVKLPDTPNKIDYVLGMTGRSAGANYDVVYMSVVLDLDPAYLFKFIDQLYRQNMCYTVVNIQSRAVDPLDRASAGYLYGEAQVIEVEVLVEGILFRSWTEPLMPDAVKMTLGSVAP